MVVGDHDGAVGARAEVRVHTGHLGYGVLDRPVQDHGHHGVGHHASGPRQNLPVGIIKVVLDTLNLDRRYRYKIQVLYLKNHKMYL